MRKFSAKSTVKALSGLLICVSLCSCMSAVEFNERVNGANYMSDTDMTAEESKSAGGSEAVETTETTETVGSAEAAESRISSEDDNNLFTPLLTEEDIEYMGIPYKDLTAEQFVQLWGQSMRECNAQRLYCITFDNSFAHDSLSDEEAELLSVQHCKEYAREILQRELAGYVLDECHDVELHEIEEAPEGYYDDENSGELHYAITYTSITRRPNALYEEYATRWITLKKIDGYWKIGLMRASSPYFFEELPTLI